MHVQHHSSSCDLDGARKVQFVSRREERRSRRRPVCFKVSARGARYERARAKNERVAQSESQDDASSLLGPSASLPVVSARHGAPLTLIEQRSP
jgi:hypothetical protein